MRYAGYGIVRQTGGFVHVESELGIGTTFHIYLPHHRDGVQPAAVVPLQRQPRDLSGKGTILLVEDEKRRTDICRPGAAQQGICGARLFRR